jgi:hypothetical protein
LDACELGVNQMGQTLGHERFGRAWYPFEQYMPAGQQGNNQKLKLFLKADQNLVNFQAHALE